MPLLSPLLLAHPLLASSCSARSVGRDLLLDFPVCEVSGDSRVEGGRSRGTSPSPTEPAQVHRPVRAAALWAPRVPQVRQLSIFSAEEGRQLPAGAYVWVNSVSLFLFSFSTTL